MPTPPSDNEAQDILTVAADEAYDAYSAAKSFATVTASLQQESAGRTVVGGNVPVSMIDVFGTASIAVLAVPGGGDICVFAELTAPQNVPMYSESVDYQCAGEDSPGSPNYWSAKAP